MHVQKFVLAIATAACLSATINSSHAAEKAYKWVDAEGVVHYGQQPPVAAESEAISIQKGFTKTVEDEPGEPTAEQKQAGADAEYCRVATENFTALSSEGEVQRKDEYGELQTMGDEEKALQRDRAKAAMDRYCKPDATEAQP